MFGLIDTIADSLSKYFRAHPRARSIALSLSIAAAILVASLFSILGLRLGSDFVNSPMVTLPFIVLGGSALIVVYSAIVAIAPSRTEAELAPIRQERERITDKLKRRNPDIFETVQLNLNQLIEYYTINKSQARNSFRASLAAIIVGFLTILAGVWLFYYAPTESKDVGYLSVIAGVILQFIGGAYFYLYNRGLAQLNFFFSRLAVMQDTMLAIKLSEKIGRVALRDTVVERLVFMIVSRDPGLLGSFLHNDNASRTPQEPPRREGENGAEPPGPVAAGPQANATT